jgi:hypothetical protein
VGQATQTAVGRGIFGGVVANTSTTNQTAPTIKATLRVKGTDYRNELSISAQWFWKDLAANITKQLNEWVAVNRTKIAEARSAAMNAKAPAAAPGWHALASWKGSGIKTTESFTTSTAEWRVNWKFSSTGILQIYVYDSSGGLVSLAANKTGAGAEISTVHTKPGKYYLTINSSGDWDVSIEEQ